MIRSLVALAVVAMAIAACAGVTAAPSGVATIDDPTASNAPDTSPSPSSSMDPEEALLAFTKCMREHGVDMPDPVINADGGTSIQVGGDGDGKRIDPKAMQAADEACRHLMAGAVGEGPGELTPEQQDAMLEFAACMREHGVEMPDPEFGTGGGFAVQIGGESDVSPDDPEFKAADEACRSILGNAMPGLKVAP